MKVYIASILMAAGWLCSFSCAAQEDNFHFNEKQQNGIRSSLDARYDGVDFDGVSWSVNSRGGFDGTFTYDDRELTATFEQDGTWVQTSERVELQDLPVKLQETLEGTAARAQIDTISKVETADHDIYYDVSYFGGAPKRYDEQGNEVSGETGH